MQRTNFPSVFAVSLLEVPAGESVIVFATPKIFFRMSRYG
jgi:hypothetical protein